MSSRFLGGKVTRIIRGDRRPNFQIKSFQFHPYMDPQQRSPVAGGGGGGDDYSDITLRPLEASDAEDYLECLSDDNVSKFCSWEPFTTVEAAAKYISEYAAPHPWYRGICVKEKAVGSVSVKPFKGCDSCRAEIGYALASKYWGKGIATKAVKMAAASVFVEWPHLERLEAVVDVDNPGSQRVLEKAGFKREAVLRKYYLLKGKPKDAVMFSLISTDPEVTFFM